MPYSEKNDSIIIAEGLVQSIQSTTTLVQSMMGELRENATALATLEAKLQALHENMQSIVHVVRDENGNQSIVTRMALIEREIKDADEKYVALKEEMDAKLTDIKEVLDELNNEKILDKKRLHQKEQFDRVKLINILKVIPGVLALVITLVNMFVK